MLHDPITQFKFLNNMNKLNKMFSGNFNELLEMSVLTYMKKLDKLYGLMHTSEMP